MRSLLSFLFLVLISCVTTEHTLDPKIYYIHDLDVRINGDWHSGMGVTQYSDEYKIKIKSPGDMTTLLIQTCHRQMKVHDAGKREFVKINPAPDEKSQNCGLMRFSTFDKKRGKHAQAIIWVDHGVYKLPAEMHCNGKSYKYKGVSVCHALNGLYQRIVFGEDVKLIEQDKERCKISSYKNKLSEKRKEFRFIMPNRECQFRFINAKGENHFLYTSGYEQNIIRN